MLEGPFPIAAIKAEAIITPTPGIVANRRASSFSFVKAANSLSKRQSVDQVPAIAREASTINKRIRGLSPCHPLLRQGGEVLFEATFALRNDDPSLQ